jgi:hypothetical protein
MDGHDRLDRQFGIPRTGSNIGRAGSQNRNFLMAGSGKDFNVGMAAFLGRGQVLSLDTVVRQ